jgi:mono/diheme cytochrome c family protein
MKIRIKLVGGVMLTAVSIMLFGSCVSDKDSSGLEYMPDMYRSPAIEPYVDYGEVKGRLNEDLKMQQSSLTPPQGAIPYYGTDKEAISIMLPWSIRPYVELKSTHGLVGFDFSAVNTYDGAAKEWTTNPYAITADNAEAIFAQGKKLFTANCVHCHGAKGDGKGPMMVNQTFLGVPNYADKTGLSDGQLFYSIYYGKGTMGSHASIVNKKEIWTLVHYIRKFQDPTYGTVFGESAELEVPVADDAPPVNGGHEPAHIN